MDNSHQNNDRAAEADKPRYVPGIGWKILFFILLPLEIWAYYQAFVTDPWHESWWLTLATSIIYAIYLVGLFGLAFAIKIGTSRFWLAYLPVQIVTDCYDMYDAFRDSGMLSTTWLLALAMMVPLILVTWWSTYRYHSVVDSFGTTARPAGA